jgi:hypothetical protein
MFRQSCRILLLGKLSTPSLCGKGLHTTLQYFTHSSVVDRTLYHDSESYGKECFIVPHVYHSLTEIRSFGYFEPHDSKSNPIKANLNKRHDFTTLPTPR